MFSNYRREPRLPPVPQDKDINYTLHAEFDRNISCYQLKPQGVKADESKVSAINRMPKS